MRALPFVPIGALGTRPHVMVDGAQRPGSVLVLSHWPGSPTPRQLWADLSCEIALSYLDTGEEAPGAECVTIDHPDEDGLASVFVLARPDEALALRDSLIAFARCGDFSVADESSAQAILTFRAIEDGALPPWRNEASSTDWRSPEGWFADLLPHLGEVVGQPGSFEPLWRNGRHLIAESEAAIAGGDVEIEEHPELDLAVVRVARPPGSERFGATGVSVHPFALHSATPMCRMLVFDAGRTVYYDRYETWVRFVSRPLPRRRDLVPLAAILSEREPGDVGWVADGPGTIIATLSTIDGAPSALGAAALYEAICSYLERAPVAWDPFAARSIVG